MIRSFSMPLVVAASLLTVGCSNLQTEYEKQAGIISDQKRIITELSQTNQHLKAEAIRLQNELQKSAVRSEYEDRIGDLSNTYAQKLQAMIQSINTQLDASLNSQEGYTRHETPEGTMIRLSEKILFRPGSADLSSSGKAILQKVADVLKQHPDRKIRVDGHSDSDPINKSKKKFSSNWDLSATRAVRVVEALTSSKGITGKRVFVAGYSEHQPIDPSSKKANRRVEIVILNN
jgi:chemotaxis protein MotB